MLIAGFVEEVRYTAPTRQRNPQPAPHLLRRDTTPETAKDRGLVGDRSVVDGHADDPSETRLLPHSERATGPTEVIDHAG